MQAFVGLMLLSIGTGLVLIGRERADGSSTIRLRGGMLMVYPALCLTFLAFGAAFVIIGL